MVSESLQKEITEFVEDKQALAAEKVAYNTKMKANTELVKEFLARQMSKEIKELHEERQQYRDSLVKLEQFVIKHLSKEITEFAEDKREVVETKVALVAEAKQRLEEMKQQFIKRSASVVEGVVTKQLTAEMTQLRQDLEEARKNDFGRRLYEAFANEYKTSFFKSSDEVSKLHAVIEEKEKAIQETQAQAQEQAQVNESIKKELTMLTESVQREKTMNALLKPLSKKQAAIMEDLLRTVKSDKLQESYDKYLPAVLNEQTIQKSTKAVITESTTVEVTGNKQPTDTPAADIIDLRKLAGLK
jgi:hypothetical protein